MLVGAVGLRQSGRSTDGSELGGGGCVGVGAVEEFAAVFAFFCDGEDDFAAEGAAFSGFTGGG